MAGKHGWLPVDDLCRRVSRSLSREFGVSESDCGERAAEVSLCVTDGESRVSAGPPHHGADPVELVPALRSQSADVCEEHLLGQAGGLQESKPADLQHELHRAAARDKTTDKTLDDFSFWRGGEVAIFLQFGA